MNQYNQRLIVKRQGGKNWSIPDVMLQVCGSVRGGNASFLLCSLPRPFSLARPLPRSRPPPSLLALACVCAGVFCVRSWLTDLCRCVLQHPVKKLRNVIKDPELLDLCKGLLAIDPALRLEGV